MVLEPHDDKGSTMTKISVKPFGMLAVGLMVSGAGPAFALEGSGPVKEATHALEQVHATAWDGSGAAQTRLDRIAMTVAVKKRQRDNDGEFGDRNEKSEKGERPGGEKGERGEALEN